MLFNSLTFLIFLPIVLAGYWLCRRSYRVQNVWLLLASYVFYAWWNWKCLFLIIGVSLVNYLAAAGIDRSENQRTRKLILAVSCVICLGVLGVFKYYNFFVESFLALIGGSDRFSAAHIVLPVGISFFTFQALSYTIDVYRRTLKPTHDLIAALTFIAFFPQLVAGPIERATNLLPQFLRPRVTTPDGVMHGICLMAYGLFKKMVVADTLSRYVDFAFANCLMYSSVTCFLGMIFFAIQIYCDFSGYSDVARGVAKLFGF